MTISRRQAIALSGSTLAGLSLGVVRPESLHAAAAQGQDDWPDPRGCTTVVSSPPEHPESAAGPISDPLMWRTQGRQTPEIEFDYRQMQIKVDTRGLARLAGTLRFSDLEQLPRVSHTFLLQCGAPNPRGIVKWTGVRFSDFADMLGLVPGVHYCRFVASDRFYADEPLTTLRHPQVMLAWMMNDEPIPGRHGAPLRLIIPFRYGNPGSAHAAVAGLMSAPRIEQPAMKVWRRR